LRVSLLSRLSVPAVLATGLGLVLACSSEDARPPELGNCVPVGDAACSAPDPGGGGGAGPPVVDSGGGGSTTAEGGASCGAATGFFTTNTTCVPCIEGQTTGILGCCEANLACSQQAGCFALLQCMLGCNVTTDPTCPGSCENTDPTGVTAYQDLAECFASECSPQCPTLPQPEVGDF
jgi:hypothetical protein